MGTIFMFIIQKHKTFTDYPPIRIYINKIKKYYI